MKNSDGITVTGIHHWEGSEKIPAEVLNLVEEEDGYFVPWAVLQILTGAYDVQFFHLDNRGIPGLFLMLDRAGGRHRQR